MKRGRLLLLALLASPWAPPVAAHPLGNFSVNRWAALRPDGSAVRVEYLVDFAEIPTFQESPAIDADGDGRESEGEIRSFARHRADSLLSAIDLTIDGGRLALRTVSSGLVFSPGAGGLRTMKLSAVYEAALPGPIPGAGARVRFADGNFEGRAGWREVIASCGPGCAVTDSTVPAVDRSQALTSYPIDLITAPPQVSRAELRLVPEGAETRVAVTHAAAPAGSSRAATTSGLTRLIGPAPARFGPGLLLAAFAASLFWGAAHALSPGHGKTIVAAYLVGQRGAPQHAVWLGLIVTITHTAGVFALGGLTLLLSRWFVPEALYAWLGFASGLTVAGMGAVLLCRRVRGAHAHSHGPGGHEHRVAERLGGKGLLALGISGGIVPCPSALVVLLSAVAFHRLLFGMALIFAFSLGLAAVLVAVGLLMVYARRSFERFDAHGSLARPLSVISAAAILVLGLGIVVQSLPQPLAAALSHASPVSSEASLAVLLLGLLFGFKHATEADHLAAISSIVSERGGLRHALLTGGLWGAGHTVSIVIAGVCVLGLHLAIPDSVARLLELGVALMIIGLGGTALVRALRNRPEAHGDGHRHDGLSRHDGLGHNRPLRAPGIKPLLVGMMHGLAGSAALTLLVLARIDSVTLGLAYLLVFGAGSIGGMAAMSALVSLPFSATASSPVIHRGLRMATACLSLAFGIAYAWMQVGAVERL